MNKPTDKEIEAWFLERQGGEDTRAFWLGAPYWTNGDVVETVKEAIQHFMKEADVDNNLPAKP